MTSRRTLLNNLLRALVQEWGLDEVEAALAQLSKMRSDAGARWPGRGESEETQKRRKIKRLSASEQVARADLKEPQRSVLDELARRYERKQFLPRVADVREFLAMMGDRPGAMKDRTEAFRRVLTVLAGLPLKQLYSLASSARHSGPSQLGPLSDAISDAGASLPRQREPDGS